MKMQRTKRGAAAVAIGASVLTGGALGVAFTTPLGAGAATAQTDSTAVTTTVPGAAGDASATARPATPPWVSEVLDALVADGTLTQDQRDKVQTSLEAARPEGGPRGEGRGPGGRHGRGGPGLDAAAEALGVSADELRTALQDGSTIAEVAASKGVDVQVVIDAIVADMSAHVDEHLADGDITQEQADARKADAVERATAMVNGERPDGPPPGAPSDAPSDAPTAE